jgi:hypothetical protein
MAETAPVTQYREEFIATFEARATLVRDTVTTEAVIKGNTATFLVAGSGGNSAVTRGVNGLIPARANDLTQTSATLAEWHDLRRMTNFNIFQSQSNQRAIMQMNAVAVLNRKIDDEIITLLNTATNDTGGTTTGSLALIMKAKVILGNLEVPWDGNITLLASPGLMAYLIQAPEFSNAQYVNMRPFIDGDPSWRDMPQAYRWMNMLVLEHPNVPSVGTSSEKCFMYHKNAIGHAADATGMDVDMDYEREQAYSWARASMHMGGVLLQNAGVVVINHDSSAFAAS